LRNVLPRIIPVNCTKIRSDYWYALLVRRCRTGRTGDDGLA